MLQFRAMWARILSQVQTHCRADVLIRSLGLSSMLCKFGTDDMLLVQNEPLPAEVLLFLIVAINLVTFSALVRSWTIIGDRYTTWALEQLASLCLQR